MFARLLAPILILLAATAAAQPAPGRAPKPLVMGEIHTFSSRVFGADRRVTVRLPTGYADQPARRHDVLYLVDGGPEQDFPHIAGLLQSGEVNGTFAPPILVGVETVARREEITPPATDLASYREELRATPGGSARFRRFLAEEVKPWVEARYRTSGTDAVMGESLAGLFVVETLFEVPTLFDDYIAVSPSLWWEDMKYGREADVRLRRLPSGPRRLYLSLADEGFRQKDGTEMLVAALRRSVPAGLDWAYLPLGKTETHSSAYHVAALDALRAFYGLPTHVYPPGRLVGGSPARPRTPAEQARLDAPCTRANARRTNPGDTPVDRGARSYECVLYDLGPRSTAGRMRR